MIPPAVLTALGAIREALPLLALALAFWAHWRADHAEARLADTRLELIELVATLYEKTEDAAVWGELERTFPEYTQGRRLYVTSAGDRRMS